MTVDRAIVPLVTPFTDDTTSLSEVRLARLIDWHRQQGASGFFVCSEAGEFTSLTFSERKQVLEWAVREAKGLPVYVNITAMTTAAAVDLCQHAERHGARAAILAPPPYGHFTADEMEMHVTAVRRYGNLPCVFVEAASGQTPRIIAGNVTAGSLQESAHAPLALARTAHPEELVLDGMFLSPIALFGAKSCVAFSSAWARYRTDVATCFVRSRSHRVGKAAFLAQGHDAGPHRGPLLGPDKETLAVIDSIVQRVKDQLQADA